MVEATEVNKITEGECLESQERVKQKRESENETRNIEEMYLT